MSEKKEEKVKEETSCGMKPNLAATLSYLFGWVSGLLFFLVEKKSKYVRFHALQSVITFGFLFVLRMLFVFIPVIGVVLNIIIGIVSLVLWIILMVKAYQGIYFKLPLVGRIVLENIEIKEQTNSKGE